MTSKERDLIEIIVHLLDAVKDLQTSCSSMNRMIAQRLPDLSDVERDTLESDSLRFIALSSEAERNCDFLNHLIASIGRIDCEFERR